MRRIRLLSSGVVIGCLAVASVSGPVAGVARPDAPRAERCLTYQQAGRPLRAPAEEQLLDVTSLSAANAWAVGTHDLGGQPSTFIRHWTGARWTTVASPNPGGRAGSALADVSAAGPSAVWAVGGYQSAAGSRTLVERWDGSRWTKVPSPNPASDAGGAQLTSVVALGADDVWAVGSFDPPGPVRSATLAEHWNGSRWSIVATPKPGVDRALAGVSASGPRDVWAVGREVRGATTTTLVLRWDGTGWRRVRSVDPDPKRNLLRGVAAIGPDDVWMAGTATGDDGSDTDLLEHYDGSTIERFKGPQLTGSSPLYDISGTSPTNSWAVGSQSFGFVTKSLVLHWDGRRWRRLASPNIGDCTWLQGVTARAPGSTWSVGFHANQTDTFALTERWNGDSWVIR